MSSIVSWCHILSHSTPLHSKPEYSEIEKKNLSSGIFFMQKMVLWCVFFSGDKRH